MEVFDEDRLTDTALDEYHDFLAADYEEAGCTCFKNPPCSFCTHPGNPSNLMDSEDAWKPAEVDVMATIRAMVE